MKKFLSTLALGLALSLSVALPALSIITDQDTYTLSAAGNGVTTNYTPGFQFQDNDEVEVYLQNNAVTPATRTKLVYGVGAGKFTITGGDPGTTVVMGTAPASTEQVYMQRVTTKTQSVDYVETEAFPAVSHERQMDRQVQLLQELGRDVDRKVGFSTSSSISGYYFPEPVTNKFLGFSAGGFTLFPATGTITSGDLLRYDGSAWSLYPDSNYGSAASLSAHIANTSNPHSTTAAQVGNSTAQWNADKIQGVDVDDSNIGNNRVLVFNSGSGNLEYEDQSGGGGLPSLSTPYYALRIQADGLDAEWAQLGLSTLDPAAYATSNTASTLVQRDASGNFAAGAITASLTGNATTATALAANPADCAAGTKATGIAANGDLTCSAVSLTADVSGITPKANGGTGYDLTTQAIELPEITTPTTPASGFGRAYFKSDGKLYQLDDAGVESRVGSAGALPLNLLKDKNWDFEAGTANWTASGGTFTTTTAAANILPPGTTAGSWDSGSAGQTLTSGSITITSGDGVSGANLAAQAYVKCATGTCTHLFEIYDGSSTLASQTITSSTSGFVPVTLNTVAPASGTISARFRSVASDEPIIYTENAYLGRADGLNLLSVSQASLAGQAYFATTASCTWPRASATLGAFTSEANCPGPTVEVANLGSWQTTDTNFPNWTVNNLPPGNYMAIVTASVGASGGAVFNEIAISDGTTVSGRGGGSSASGTIGSATAVGYFTYTTAGNRTFEVFGAAASNTINIYNGNSTARTQLTLYRFPLSSEQAVSPATSPMSWNGYHDSTCSWPRTNTGYGDPTADASCAFTERTNRNAGTVTSYLSGSDKLPGIVMTLTRTGMKMICTRFGALNGSTGTTGYRLTDGTTVIFELNDSSQTTYKSQFACGIYNATSIGSKTFRLESKASTSSATISTEAGTPSVEWNVFDLDQSFPAAYLTGSVTSNSSGQERVERARVGTTNATTVCSVTPCSFLSQSGSWLSSVSRGSAGVYTLNIAAGIFSDVPSCSITGGGGGSLIYRKTTAATSTSWTIAGETSGGTPTDFYFDVQCMGPR